MNLISQAKRNYLSKNQNHFFAMHCIAKLLAFKFLIGGNFEITGVVMEESLWQALSNGQAVDVTFLQAHK